MTTSKIEITFPVSVYLPAGFERALDGLINMVCEQYQKDNPTRVMWLAGQGGKRMGSIMDDGADYDMSYLCIDIDEREDLHGANLYNPKREELRAFAARKARKNIKTNA